MRTRQAIGLAAVGVAAAALATGCGSSPSPQSGGKAPQGPGAAAYAYSRCMRAHGVTGFPDPHVQVKGGSVQISQVAPESLAASPAFKSASKACAYLQPGPGSRSSVDHGPGKQVLLAFARCLRATGVSGFPDPNAQGRLTMEMISAAGVDIHSPSFFTAARKCVGVTHGAITVAEVASLVNGHH